VSRDIVYTPSEVGALGTKYLEYRRDHKDHGVPFGLPSIDKDFIPALPGELITVIGRPGSGKTGFMKNWARRRALHLAESNQENRVVIYATYEQHIEDLHMFDVAAEEGYSITEMSRGNITDEMWGAVERNGVSRLNLPLWYIGHSMERRKKRPSLTVDEISKALRSIEEWNKEKYVIDMVFIDYLQRMPLPTRSESKTIGTSHNLDRLKDGSLAFGCPFVVGVQARREVDKYPVPVPGMDDGAWTSNIEQASDKIFSVVRPCLYGKTGEKFGSGTIEGHCQIIVSLLKQKLGPANKAYWLYFDPEKNFMSELQKTMYPTKQPF